MFEQVDEGMLPANREGLLNVYRRAFAGPPYNRREGDAELFGDQLAKHSRYEGFRCFVARDAGRVVGFTYGYKSRPGQWWHGVVARHLGPELTRRWLSDGFELVELAVLPEAQGRGIGARLHDLVLQGLPYRTAALTTHASETPAMRLYRRRGWTVLRDDVSFPGYREPYAVLGLDLGARSVRGGPEQGDAD